MAIFLINKNIYFVNPSMYVVETMAVFVQRC